MTILSGGRKHSLPIILVLSSFLILMISVSPGASHTLWGSSACEVEIQDYCDHFPEASMSEKAWELFDLINDYRQSQNPPKPALGFSPKLTNAAVWMANDLTERTIEDSAPMKEWHIDSCGRDGDARIPAFGYHYQSGYGENIATHATAGDALGYWKGSPPHNKTLLKDELKVMGIGYAYDDESQHKHYWVVDFGDVDYSTFDANDAGTPDHLHKSSGESFNVTISVKNTGVGTWRESDQVRLGLKAWNDQMGANIRYSLNPGETVRSDATRSWTVNLRAPMSRGTYEQVWQMVREDGQVGWFGDLIRFEVHVDDTIYLKIRIQLFGASTNHSQNVGLQIKKTRWGTPLLCDTQRTDGNG